MSLIFLKSGCGKIRQLLWNNVQNDTFVVFSAYSLAYIFMILPQGLDLQILTVETLKKPYFNLDARFMKKP